MPFYRTGGNRMRKQELEIKTIYNTVLKLLSINNNIELVEDFKRVLLILEHYYQISNAKQLLILSLHICKLDSWDNSAISTKLNDCIQYAMSKL